MANSLYAQLMESAAATSLAADDRHVLASIVAIAAQEGSLAEGLGLYGSQLQNFLQTFFPGALPYFGSLDADAVACCDREEDSIRELLCRFRTPGSALAPLLASLVARRAMRPNHLWQDLGLNHRGELSGLMNRHFAPLARRNRQDMKWKKFFYRMTCSEEGFALCAAPVCSECCDFQTCFGDESGPSLLARSSLYAAALPKTQQASV
jgi:nitrogen fixation protein NifQ